MGLFTPQPFDVFIGLIWIVLGLTVWALFVGRIFDVEGDESSEHS